MTRLHERTATVVRFRDSFPVVRFDDPTRCCGHPHCANVKPRFPEDELAFTRDERNRPFVVGERVRTFWEQTATRGGLAAERIVEEVES